MKNLNEKWQPQIKWQWQTIENHLTEARHIFNMIDWWFFFVTMTKTFIIQIDPNGKSNLKKKSIPRFISFKFSFEMEITDVFILCKVYLSDFLAHLKVNQIFMSSLNCSIITWVKRIQSFNVLCAWFAFNDHFM